MEQEFNERKAPRDDIILRFTLDGLYFSLRAKQDGLTQEQLEADLAKFFPDAELIKLPEEATYDDGA